MSVTTIVVIVSVVVMLVSVGGFGYFMGKRNPTSLIDYHKVFEQVAKQFEAKEKEIAKLDKEAKRIAARLKELEQEDTVAVQERTEEHEKAKRGSMSDIDRIIYEHHQSVKRSK